MKVMFVVRDLNFFFIIYGVLKFLNIDEYINLLNRKWFNVLVKVYC